RLTVTAVGVCANQPATADVMLTGNPHPTASASAGSDGNVKCRNAIGQTRFGPLNGSGTNIGTIQWAVFSQMTNPAGCPIQINNAATLNPTVCFAQGCFGFATVRMTITGSGVCANTVATADVTLQVAEMPTCAINPNPACVGDQLCATPCDGVGSPD